jgi:hypothetical protein
MIWNRQLMTVVSIMAFCSGLCTSPLRDNRIGHIYSALVGGSTNDQWEFQDPKWRYSAI